LGGLAADLDGRPVQLPADARARELLGWLVVSPGLHARSTLAGRLRPDVGEESARKTLRDAVYELRRALGPAGRDAIVATRDQVGLEPAFVRADLWEFRRAVAAGKLDEAVEGRMGELLAGMDADWVLRARDEHTAELAGVLAPLAQQAEDAGDLDAAVRWTRRRLEVDPLAEEAHRELIRRLARAGDRPAALTAATSLADRLRRELGVPPSPETRALVEDVRRGRRDAAAPAPVRPASLPPALMRTASPEGRQPALDRLEVVWNEALAGETRVALIAGEPGIGKTTLAGELARRVHAAGAAVLYGRCVDQVLVPYQPWVEALERLLADLPPDETEHWLTAHDGALARLLPARGGEGAPEPGARARYLAFESVRGLLEHAAATRPVLLVLDDLLWVDADSAALLRHLVGSLVQARLLVLVTAREQELTAAAAETLAEVRRAGPLLHEPLSGLDDEAVAVLLARHGVDVAAAPRYRERTGGNPFFLEELLRDERERGGAAEGPPAGVRDVVDHRLARLTDTAREALALAATMGLRFDLKVLAAAGDRPVDELLDALDEAVAAGLVVRGAGERFAFAHALVAEAILSALPASRRARLHLQLAEALEAAGDAPPGRVASHLQAAGPLAPTDRVVRWSVAAAREATEALAHSDAAAHLAAALAAGPPARDRPELLIALGHAHDRAGEREAARASFAEAAALARARGDPTLLSRASLGFAGLAVVVAAPDPELIRLLEEALEATPAEERGTRGRLRAQLAVESYYADPAAAESLSEQAVSDARASGDQGALAAALNARRVALWRPAHARTRLDVVDEMIVAAEAAGDREAVLQAHNWRVVDLWELGRMDELQREIDAYERLADELGLPHYRWYVPLWRASLAILAGRWDEGRALTAQAEALGRRAADPNAPLHAGIQQEQFSLFAQYRMPDVDREWSLQQADSAPMPEPWLAAVAHIDARSGRHDSARELLERLTRTGVAMDVNWLQACLLADAAADLGDVGAAAHLHGRLEPYTDLFPVIARGAGCYCSTELYLGRLAATLGRLDEAESRLRRAVAVDDAVGSPTFAAISMLRLGGVLAERGDAAGARDTLTETVARAEALAMPTLAAAAAAALKRGTAPNPRGTRAAPRGTQAGTVTGRSPGRSADGQCGGCAHLDQGAQP
jgi:DNA-binding SARP family transcriptional activator/tetratricopeptide (TPR) repeat protein